MDDNTIKSITIILFFIDTLLFGNLPYFLIHKPGSNPSKSSHIRDIIISYLNCFAGGVFLGACLLHLLVEGRETLDEYFSLVGTEMTFPVYETIVAGGFFLIALIEQLAHMYLERMDTVHPLENDIRKDRKPADLEVTSMNFNAEAPVNSNHNTDVIILSGTINPAVANGISPLDTLGADKKTDQISKDGSGEDNEGVFKVMQVKPMRAFLLLGAFSFHTVFDGLAVGLQQNQAAIWQMFAAICIHKSLVAVCLGLQLFLVYKDQPIKAFICILVFSFISPIGVGVGMSVLSSNINPFAKTLSRGILEGISTGTFLYVAFFEILHEELGNKRGLLRLFLVLLGFAGTCLPKLFHTEE